MEEAIEFLREHPEHTNVGIQDKYFAETYERPLQTKHTYKTQPTFRKTYNRKGLDLQYASQVCIIIMRFTNYSGNEYVTNDIFRKIRENQISTRIIIKAEKT